MTFKTTCAHDKLIVTVFALLLCLVGKTGENPGYVTIAGE